MDLAYFFARRYIAGRSFKEAIPAVRRLKERGLFTTIDYVGESVINRADAGAVVDEYCQVLTALKDHGLDVNVSIKLSQLGLDIDDNFCFDNVSKILITASRMDAFVRVDMEGSAYTQKTIDMVMRWHRIYPYLGTVVQAMLKRTEADVDRLLAELVPVRLCKGAYKEPAAIALADKREVNDHFLKLSRRLLTSDLYHGLATHDEAIVDAITAFCLDKKIRKDQFEFQMLYGIHPKLENRLVADGYHVRIYVPYGKGWFPYVVRRLRERKENIWFVAKSLFRF